MNGNPTVKNIVMDVKQRGNYGMQKYLHVKKLD